MGRRRRRQQQDEKLDPTRSSIAVVGSGLAGLSAAICLQQAGFDNITIYERDASFDSRKEGYGMTLTYNPQGILEQLGVLEALARADCPSRSHYLLQAPAGRVLGYFGNAFTKGRGVGQRGNLRVPRQRVRRILIDQLLSSEASSATQLRWNHTLREIKYLNGTSNTIPEQPISSYDSDDTCRAGPIQLYFTNGTVAHADLVIAADGWRSTALQCVIPDAPQPRSLGIHVIVGLAVGVDHALVRESGFYTLGRGQRLFVMPFRGTTLDRDLSQRQTMWQLSFACESLMQDEDDEESYVRTPNEYWQHARDLMRDWHDPVPQLVEATPVSTVWGTLLHDRDPLAIWQSMLASSSAVSSRMVVVGDALHAMSPFKGQGANQALADGAVLARWLQRARVNSAVQGAMREIVQRTNPVVRASREAAVYWHSPDAWRRTEQHSFAGLTPQISTVSLQESLTEVNITASTVDDLDSAIRQHLHHAYPDFWQTPGAEATATTLTHALIGKALMAAQRGELETLRLLTWEEHARLVQSVVDPETGNTCLHQALVLSEPYQEKANDPSVQKYWKSRKRLVTWLVTEAGCDLEQTNHEGRRPLDVARACLCLDRETGVPTWWEPLRVWQKGQQM